jgi:hypothetical protein
MLIALTKERGQARLPDLELIEVEFMIASGTAFNAKTIAQVQEARGWEGGLAPALIGRSKHSLVQGSSTGAWSVRFLVQLID